MRILIEFVHCIICDICEKLEQKPLRILVLDTSGSTNIFVSGSDLFKLHLWCAFQRHIWRILHFIGFFTLLKRAIIFSRN